MSVFVTGSTGFIGKQAVDTLRAEGLQVIAGVRADRDNANDSTACNLFDPNALATAFKDCRAVVHTAGVHHPDASEALLGWTNVAGTKNALAAAEHAGVEKFIYVSCCDVTLVPKKREHWNEDQALTRNPLSLHGQTMREAEEWVLGHVGQTKVVVLRAATVWGKGDNHWLPALTAEMKTGKLLMPGRGQTLYCLTHVENLAHAVNLALGSNEAAGGVYHITDDEMFLACDIFEDMRQLLELPVKFVKDPLLTKSMSAEAIKRRYSHAFDGRRAKRDLQYHAVVSYAQGLEGLKDWVKTLGVDGLLARKNQTFERLAVREARASDVLSRPQSA